MTANSSSSDETWYPLESIELQRIIRIRLGRMYSTNSIRSWANNGLIVANSERVYLKHRITNTAENGRVVRRMEITETALAEFLTATNGLRVKYGKIHHVRKGTAES